MKDEHAILLGEINGKVDQIISRQDSEAKTVKSIAVRVNSLEKWKAWLLGLGAAGGAGASITLGKVKDLI